MTPDPGTIVRPASTADARAIAAVHVASWRAAYQSMLPADYLASLSVTEREARWTQTLSDGPARVLVALTGGRLVKTGGVREVGAQQVVEGASDVVGLRDGREPAQHSLESVVGLVGAQP